MVLYHMMLLGQDCRAELSAFLFAEQVSPLPADALLQQMLHLLSLPRPETEAAPSGQRKSRSKEEADDPLIIQELAAQPREIFHFFTVNEIVNSDLLFARHFFF